jgi:hypothetical protein
MALAKATFERSVLIRSAAVEKIREADAIMWAGGTVRAAPGELQAEPTIGKAMNGGYDLLKAKCNRCRRVSVVPLRSLRQPAERLYGNLRPRFIASRAARVGITARARAHILGLTYARPDPVPPQKRGKSR